MDALEDSWLSGYEVSSPSGQTFIVKAAPRGIPFQLDNAPSTSIIANLLWQVYLGVVSALSRRWKVAVIYRSERFLQIKRVVYREVLSGGVLPEERLRELVEECCVGAFDR